MLTTTLPVAPVVAKSGTFMVVSCPMLHDCTVLKQCCCVHVSPNILGLT